MKPYSYHIFLFPFKWNLNEEGKVLPSELLKFGWQKNVSQDNVSDYNEQKYFHPYVHPCLFENTDNPLIKQFCHEESLHKNWQFEINLKRRIPIKDIEPLFKDQIIKPPDKYEYEDKDWIFTLTIEKVTLDVYEEQGIGIFAFHLKNTEYQNPEDILLINQFGRRIFPPFLDKHYPDFKINKISEPIDGTIYREMPCSVTIKGKGIEDVPEDFAKNFRTGPFKTKDYVPAHIRYFFRNNTKASVSENLLASNEEEPNKILNIMHILDDRMFVICWYGAKQLTYDFRKDKLTQKQEKKQQVYVLSDLCQRKHGGFEVSGFYRNELQHRSLALHQTHDSYGYASNDFWYQYVFVDGYGPSCANVKLRTEQIEKHTYSRWVEANTLYGITRYSFVCLSEPISNLEKPFPNAGFIVDHIQTVYFQMVSLVLVQRAMIIDFSKKISLIDISIDNEDRTKHKEALSLYKAYRDFINKIFHREVTAQEQGIELYDMLQEHLRIEKQAKELEKEFDEMNRLITLIKADQSSARMKIFTILGGIFLIPTFIFNLLKNKNFDDLKPIQNFLSGEPAWKSIYLLLFLIGFAFFFTKAILSWTDKESFRLSIKELINSFNSIKIYKKRMLFLLIACIIFVFYLTTFQLPISLIWVVVSVVLLIVLILFSSLVSKK